jgi:hypothetical protein
MTAFDGDAISRADREFLARLGDHPLAWNSFYGKPCPPQPDLGTFRPEEDNARQAKRKAFFATVIDWMLVNYAYREGAFVSKGGAISLVDGEIISLADLRARMAPWALLAVGPHGGVKMHSPVDDWLRATARLSVRREEMRPDRPRPTFAEDGHTIFNRYRPPAHSTEGGEIAGFEAFLARLIPDDDERKWFWNWLAHKARRPWVPSVAIIMVAEEFGTGRGTLFDILELLFGKDYVVPCTFGELTGAAAGARFNARLADALIAVVNEAVAEDGHQQAQRRLAYEALKNAIDPSPTARRRFEAKGQHAYSQRSAMSGIVATNHRDVIKLPRDDRRFCVLTCGTKMTAPQTAAIRAWMAVPENIGALHRALLATPAAPLDVFDPFGAPPPFAGRIRMIGMGETRLEDAYGATVEALEGFPLFTLTQAQRLIGYFGDFKTGDWPDKARHTVAKNACRLRERSEPNNRIRYRKRQEIIYACAEPERRRWRRADNAMIAAQLDRTEAMIVRLVNTGQDDIMARLKEIGREPPEEDEE